MKHKERSMRTVDLRCAEIYQREISKWKEQVEISKCMTEGNIKMEIMITVFDHLHSLKLL
jgi:hypothetical protein